MIREDRNRRDAEDAKVRKDLFAKTNNNFSLRTFALFAPLRLQTS